MNTENAKGIRRPDTDDLLINGKPGDFVIEKENERIWMYIPGAGIIHIPVKINVKSPSYWQWDGNETAPTIIPSINVIHQWHGYMTNGELVSC